MGGTESSEGCRLSFGMDEEERVRVLQGIRLYRDICKSQTLLDAITVASKHGVANHLAIVSDAFISLRTNIVAKLSENVVNRMKDSSQPSKVGQLTFPAPPPSSTFGTSKGPEKDSKLPRLAYGGDQQPSGVEEDLLKRYKRKQNELFQVVTKEREATMKHWSASLHRGEGSIDQEKQKSALLARELENQEAELRCHNIFYKEQLEHIERKNAEMYKLSSQQFHEAASKIEGTVKPRRLEPVCSGLQAQILHCYRDHLHEVLLCSDLVKAYQHCVSAAHKG